MKFPRSAGVSRQRKMRSTLFGALALSSFVLSIALAPLGSFIVWIFGGSTLYFLFLAVYENTGTKKRPPGQDHRGRRKPDPQQAEIRAHIAFHMPILISMFLLAVLVLVVILFFF